MGPSLINPFFLLFFFLIRTGPEIGMFKDELNGKLIKEALFLGIKQYGYTINDNGVVKNYSVFAGVPRNSIPFKDMYRLAKGEIIQSDGQLRFYKSFHNLTIKTNVVSIKIKQNNFKNLSNNKYLPLNINLIDNNYRKLFYLLSNKVLVNYKNVVKSINKFTPHNIVIIIIFLFTFFFLCQLAIL